MGRGMMMRSGSVSVGRPGSLSVGRAAAVSTGQTAGNITITVNNNNNSTPAATNVPFTDFNFIPVPGLGFDIPHLAATRGAAAVGALPGQFAGTTVGFPLFDSGFFIPTVPTIVVQVPPIVIQQPVIVQQPAAAETSDSAPAQTQRPVAVEEAPKEPERESPEYVFVRRDGKVLFAVAFMWGKNQLEYVTRDGLRRSIEIGTLDLEATKKFNEERGLTFRLPA